MDELPSHICTNAQKLPINIEELENILETENTKPYNDINIRFYGLVEFLIFTHHKGSVFLPVEHWLIELLDDIFDRCVHEPYNKEWCTVKRFVENNVQTLTTCAEFYVDEEPRVIEEISAKMYPKHQLGIYSGLKNVCIVRILAKN
jgi:hypothetical protein